MNAYIGVCLVSVMCFLLPLCLVTLVWLFFGRQFESSHTDPTSHLTSRERPNYS